MHLKNRKPSRSLSLPERQGGAEGEQQEAPVEAPEEVPRTAEGIAVGRRFLILAPRLLERRWSSPS